jgi:hypothetical protein
MGEECAEAGFVLRIGVAWPGRSAVWIRNAFVSRSILGAAVRATFRQGQASDGNLFYNAARTAGIGWDAHVQAALIAALHNKSKSQI